MDEKRIAPKKTCGKCKRLLPVRAFWRNKKTHSGMQSRCKECLCEYHLRPENIARKRAYDAKYRRHVDPDAERQRKAAVTRNGRKTIEGKARHSARETVRYAIRTGKLKRQPCEVCGTAEAVHAHHYLGYAKEHRLSVQWLCKRHHSDAHAVTAP